MIGAEDHPDQNALEADFRERGFLAPLATTFVPHFRRGISGWFEVAEELNILGQRIYLESNHLIIGKAFMDPVALGLLATPRALGAFQGAILLAERGMGNQAQTLVRTVYECAFWIGYFSRDPGRSVPEFEHETLKSEIGLHEASLRHLGPLDPDVEAQVRESIVEMRQRCSQLPKPPGIEELAHRAGQTQNYFMYKDLWLGCLGLALLLGALQELTAYRDRDAELQLLNERLEQMPPYRQAET